MNKEEYIQQEQQKVIDRIQSANKSLHVLEYINANTRIKIHCDKCCSDFDISSSALRSRQYRCPICENKDKAHPLKTIEEERPDLIEWLINEDDKKIGRSSKKIIRIKCPVCGTEESVPAHSFVNRIYTCQSCNKDGISYPNKFLRAFLKQVKDQAELIETEWNPDWAKNYKYDGHIIKSNISYIIEMHGPQHYEQTSFWDFEDQKRRDDEKEKLSKENNVEQIIIECKKSNFEYIKKHIEESKLSQLLNLNEINWEKIAEESAKDYTKDIADLYNNGTEITKIGQKFMIDRHTVTRILKEATIIGWCNYEAIPCTELSKINVKITNVKTNESKVIHGINEACKFIKEDSGNKIDRHTMKHYVQGYYWSYYHREAREKTSLKGKLYKDTYKFEYINDDLVTTTNDTVIDKEKT